MIKELRLGTWNIKNDFFLTVKNDIKVTEIIKILKNKNLDILALQEVNPIVLRLLNNRLSRMLTPYRINFSPKTINPVKNLRVEYNVIISKLRPIGDSYNYDLPYMYQGFELIKNIGSIHIRNMTSQVFEGNLLINNTHLDHVSTILGRKQMDEVFENIIDEVDGGFDVFLLGNLNSKPSEANMIDFRNKLHKLELDIVKK